MKQTDPGRRRWVARAALVLTALTLAAALPDGAGAADPHRAAVIVETGADTHRVVVTFTEDSITGIEALRRAGADPVVYSFTGQGGAVCRLYGVGRDASSNCLGGQDGDNRYWAYFRAPAGTSTFEYSRVGAGTVQVRDGDVEGWRFGAGQPPQYVSLQSLAPPPPPTNTPAAPSGSSSSGATSGPAALGASGPAATTPGAPATASTLPATGDAPTTGAAANDDEKPGGSAAAGAERSGDRDDRRAAATETALASSNADEDSNSALSLLWLALLLVAIGVAIVVVRRVRRRGATSS
jgi:hypothetical protein